jgi:hypothetical protein
MNPLEEAHKHLLLARFFLLCSLLGEPTAAEEADALAVYLKPQVCSPSRLDVLRGIWSVSWLGRSCPFRTDLGPGPPDAREKALRGFISPEDLQRFATPVRRQAERQLAHVLGSYAYDAWRSWARDRPQGNTLRGGPRSS